jgi:predicted patatin/cPLA2 family phospholipase
MIVVAIILGIGVVFAVIVWKVIRDAERMQALTFKREKEMVEETRIDESKYIEFLSAEEIEELHKKGAITIIRDDKPLTILASDKWKKQ